MTRAVQSEAGDRRETEKITRAVQVQQAIEKRTKKITRAVHGCTGLCRAVLAVLGCVWLCLAVLGCAGLAFVNLKWRFPFACCTGFRVIGAHFRSKIDLKNDKISTLFFIVLESVLGPILDAFGGPKSMQDGPSWAQDGS